jgi:hypothetical protein
MNAADRLSAPFRVSTVQLCVVLLFLATRAGNAAEPTGSAAPVSEWSASYTGLTEPAQVVIDTQPKWEAVWRHVFGNEAVPPVDFERGVVACVFLGTRPTGGYRVMFGEPFVRGKQYVIPYMEHKPTGFVTEALTQPCAMKVFERQRELEVIIEKTQPPAKPEIQAAGNAVPAAAADTGGTPSAAQWIDFAGVARCEAPRGWEIERTDGAADPELRFSSGENIIRACLFGGAGSRFATQAAYLTGFAATTMGRPPERIRPARVAGIEIWIYRHGYPIQLGDPHVHDPRPPTLADEEFCLIPLKERFVVLSWACEGPPNPDHSDNDAWQSFLDSFRIDG